MRKIKKSGFSLMEMMIVLLIVSIVAAATAPLVTKKMANSAKSGSGAWSYIGLSNSITYNQNSKDVTAAIGTKNVPGIHPRLFINGAVPLALGNANTVRGTFRIDNNNNLSLETGQNFIYNPNGGNMSAIIGSNSRPNNINPKLYIKSSGNEPQLTLGDSVGNFISLVTDLANGRMGLSNAAIPNNTTALGTSQTINNAATGSVVIGNNVTANGARTVTIGNSTRTGTNDSIAIGNNAIAELTDSIAIGNNISTGDDNPATSTRGARSIVIGSGNSRAKGNQSIAIGNRASANGDNSIAIGGCSTTEANVDAGAPGAISIGRNAIIKTGNSGSIAIGQTANIGSASSSLAHNIAIGLATVGKNANYSTAIGNAVWTNNEYSATTRGAAAIGSYAQSNHNHAVVIGTGSGSSVANPTIAKSTHDNQIVLGSGFDTVYIPGNLVVNGATILGYANDGRSAKGRGHSSRVFLRESQDAGDMIQFGRADHTNGTMHSEGTLGEVEIVPGFPMNIVISDRRLKNVGEKFTSGLEQIKKLDLYNFTFKKDEAKTPQVGVMAQDLQKIFPNAVWKGEDGYLRIRWDEMFYAVINAVKELDAKVTTAFEQIKANTDKVAKLQAQVDEQKQEIKELKAQNAEFEKRLAKLEKKEK